MVRPTSLTKPTIEVLRAQGVTIRAGDLKDDAEQLKAVLAGVDILVSAVSAWAIENQKAIIRVAAELGTVERVVPCDFGTPGRPGLRELHDRVSVP